MPAVINSSAEKEVRDSSNKSFKDGKGGLLVPFLPRASIDKKGSLVNYRAFLVKLDWGSKRIGDQLPYEYEPKK